MKINSKAIIIGLLILVLAAVLRFVNLNSLPIFADEAIYVRWSQVMRAESSLRFLPLSDGKQPLFMWATIPILKIFTTDPLLAGRTLSGLCGLASVFGVGTAAYLLFKNSHQALLSAAIYAVLPYAVFFDRMALADSMLTMFFIWTFVFSYLSIKHLRLDFAMIAGFMLGFAWLTKSPAIFAAALIFLNLFFLPKFTLKNLLIATSYLLTTIIIAYGMYNILRLGPQFHMIAIRNADYVYPLAEILKHPLDPLIPHLKDSFQFYLYLLTPFGVLAGIVGIAAGKFSHWKNRLILAAWCLGPIFIESAMAKQFTARYILFTVPFAVLLIGHAAEHIGQHTRKHFLSIASACLVIIPGLIFAYLLAFNVNSLPLPKNERSGYLEEWTAGQGLIDVSQKIRQYANQGTVVVGSEGFFGTPFDALGLYLNDLSNVRVVGVGVSIDSMPSGLANAVTLNQTFLVVNSSRFHADPDKIGLKLISSYQKATPVNGLPQQLLFFQVLPAGRQVLPK